MANDIVIKQGATYKATVTWFQADGVTPVNLTGYHARFQVRLQEDSATALVDISDGAGIVLGGAAGTLAITISSTVTAALTGWKEGICELLVADSGGTKTSLFKKKVILDPGVVR